MKHDQTQIKITKIEHQDGERSVGVMPNYFFKTNHYYLCGSLFFHVDQTFP